MSESSDHHVTEANKNAVMNQLLEMTEMVQSGQKMLHLIDGTSFNELTPECWAEIVSGVPKLQQLLTVSLLSIQSGAQFIDDPDGQKFINRQVDRILNPKSE